MKFLFLAFLTSICAFSWERERQPSLHLVSGEGAALIISYSSEGFQGINTFGMDVHIEEIVVFANGLNQIGHVNAFINGHKIRIDCDGQYCVKKASEEDYKQSLYSQNVFFLGYRSQPTTRPIYASFQINEKEWLIDPVRNDTYFKLMVKDRP